jgi:hypothetical protein
MGPNSSPTPASILRFPLESLDSFVPKKLTTTQPLELTMKQTLFAAALVFALLFGAQVQATPVKKHAKHATQQETQQKTKSKTTETAVKSTEGTMKTEAATKTEAAPKSSKKHHHTSTTETKPAGTSAK